MASSSTTKRVKLRKEYSERGLNHAALNPLQQFEKWFAEACRARFYEANAMLLATATKNGVPSLRAVLLKGFGPRGFVFFTNYESRKGRELKQNPRAALLFYWDKLERQIRIEGRVKKISRAESERYFHSRPRGSQLGSYISPQSKVVSGRAALESWHQEAAARFQGSEVPCPKHWGGYVVVPTRLEFWQGRRNRIHDRIEYVRTKRGWQTRRLAP